MATYPTSLALSPANNRFAVSQTVNNDRDLKVFDIKDGRDRTPAELAKLSGVESFEFAPDGRSIAVLFSAGVGEAQRNSVGVWRLHDGRQIAMRQGAGLSYSFNSAGDQLAVAMQEDTIELLDVRSGKTNVLPTLRPILLVAFSRNDQLLATADAKGLVTLIELSGLTEVANFQHDSKVSKVVFSKSGKYLATATEPDDRDQASDALHVWLLRPKDLIKEACERLSRLRDTPLSYCASR